MKQSSKRTQFPPESETVREAIINALCHRNYTEVGTIQVRIYDDRLEVWNPGKMPSDLSVAELYHQHASRPRNPLLANALFRTRLIEQWGTGTLRIIEACQPHNIKVEFESAMGMFIVRLKQLAPPSTKPESQPESRPESQPESLDQRVMRLVKDMPLTKAAGWPLTPIPCRKHWMC